MSTPAGRQPAALVDLGPLEQLRAGRLPRRLVQLYAGLALFGVSLGRTGRSLRLVRTGIEVTVVLLGLLLGGILGFGTVLHALTIGPLTQLWLPGWTVEVTPRRA